MCTPRSLLEFSALSSDLAADFVELSQDAASFYPLWDGCSTFLPSLVAVIPPCLGPSMTHCPAVSSWYVNSISQHKESVFCDPDAITQEETQASQSCPLLYSR